MYSVAPPAHSGAVSRLRALQARIVDEILDRGLAAGDPLPTETELAATLGVGRNALRECLKMLQGLGIIEIRHGFGTFVAPSNVDALGDALSFRGRLSLRHGGREAIELVEVRQALEAALIGSAMDVMTPAHRSLVETAVVEMEERAARDEDVVDADARFHRLLFEPLQNRLLLDLMSVFWTVYGQLHHEVSRTPESLRETAVAHRGIYDAVAAGDARAAADRLRGHFDGIRRLISDHAPDAIPDATPLCRC